MILASNSSKNKIFHYSNCKYAAKIKPENLIRFKDKDEARNHGYIHCPHCSRLIKYYEKEKKHINNYIRNHALQMYIEDDSMYVDNTFSSWKITVESDGYRLELWHANSESYDRLQSKNGHLIHHYHNQNYKGIRDILNMLKYIVEHDKWKDDHNKEYMNLPRKTKNQRKAYNEAKKDAKKVEIRNLYNLIDRVGVEMKNKKK